MPQDCGHRIPVGIRCRPPKCRRVAINSSKFFDRTGILVCLNTGKKLVTPWGREYRACVKWRVGDEELVPRTQDITYLLRMFRLPSDGQCAGCYFYRPELVEWGNRCPVNVARMEREKDNLLGVSHASRGCRTYHSMLAVGERSMIEGQYSKSPNLTLMVNEITLTFWRMAPRCAYHVNPSLKTHVPTTLCMKLIRSSINAPQASREFQEREVPLGRTRPLLRLPLPGYPDSRSWGPTSVSFCDMSGIIFHYGQKQNIEKLPFGVFSSFPPEKRAGRSSTPSNDLLYSVRSFQNSFSFSGSCSFYFGRTTIFVKTRSRTVKCRKERHFCPDLTVLGKKKKKLVRPK